LFLVSDAKLLILDETFTKNIQKSYENQYLGELIGFS